MSEFFRETRIKRTRKAHFCCGCEKRIEAGSEAFYMAMKQDGEFITAHAHVECRVAEIDWNHEADTWGEDWAALWQIREDDEADDWCAWLREKHPVAAERVLPEPVA